MTNRKQKSQSIRPDAGLNQENPRFFREMFDLGLVPIVTECMRENLLAAASKLEERDGGLNERQAKTVRTVTASKLAEMFLLGKQIEIEREMSTKLQPCTGCAGKVNFYFLSDLREPIWRGYVLCSGCKLTKNFRGSPDEIVDKWNSHAPGDRW